MRAFLPALALAAFPVVAAPARAAEPALTLTLAPRSAGAGIGSVDVTLRFEGVGAAAGAPLLRLPLVVSNVDTVATTLAALSAEDANGPLRLTARDVDLPETNVRDAVAGGPSREWLTDRATAGPVRVHYTVPAGATLPPRGPAPPFAFSNDGGAMSAAGHVFLLLPPGPQRYRATIDWKLDAAPKGSRAFSSFGAGRVSPPEPVSGTELRMSFFMAGPLGAYPAPAPDGANPKTAPDGANPKTAPDGANPKTAPETGFFSAWQGAAPFDADALMQWTSRLYGHYARFFGQAAPPSYAVFLRYNPVNAGGGVGLHHSFVATFGRDGGQGTDPAQLKFTLAHEMFHTFQPFLDQPAGLAASWFGEGLATFYQSRLPLRFGMITADEFLADINGTAARYYTSLMAMAPNSEVPRRFWADTRIRTLPYDRGMLYFASLDEAVRKASGGKRSLDDLMLAMLARHKAGETLTPEVWEGLLRAELGEAAVRQFRAVLAGEARPLPGSDAFGPCFRRTTKPLRRYELGFEPAVLAEPRRVVRGLVPGSAAARAGVRDGDEIVQPVPQDAIQGDQTALLKLEIRRDGKVFALSYLPRGETVEAIQWERVPGSAGRACAL